ncbi:MAG: hypothetical protein ACK4MS_10580 [Paracoccaceae bacterium]
MSHLPPEPPANVVPFPGKLSSGKRVDLRSGQAFDLYRAGVEFPDLWMAFLRGHFANPVSVAFHFGVTERAAEKWWNGVGGPRGDKVAVALRTVPGAADALLRAA